MSEAHHPGQGPEPSRPGMPRPGTPDRGRIARRLAGNLFGLVRDVAVAPIAARVPREWLVLRLDRGVAEAPSNTPAFLAQIFPRPTPLADLLRALERAPGDPKLRGVLVRAGQESLGWARLAEIVRALAAVRAAHKPVVVWSEHTGNAGAWLGAQADHFWMAPEGRLDLVGVRARGWFLRRALDQLEIRPDVISAGRFKSAGEMLERDSLSDEARENLDDLVDAFYAQLVDGLAQGRAHSAERAREWIDAGPYLAAEAHDAGIVDGLVYPDELPLRLAELAGRDFDEHEDPRDTEPRWIGVSGYLSVSRPRFRWRPLVSGGGEIAIVPLVGALRPGAGSSKGVAGVLRALERRDDVRGVVVRIDCPGGDVTASDLIWRAVRRLAERKPVIASMGDVAASGGYYAAMAAHEIVAEPATLTGSIGVVLTALGFEGLLTRLGVSSDGVERGRHAGIFDAARTRSDEDRERLAGQVDRAYRSFVAKAAECRGMDVAALDAVAEGRVWSGQQALEHGLVDRLGGLDDAVGLARERAGLAAGEGEARYYVPSPPSGLRALRGDPFDGRARPASWVGASAVPQVLCPIRIPLA